MTSVPHDDTDLDVLARTIWGEARGESAEGRIAVAWVIRNRLDRPHRFKPTIAAICQQARQFSCWNVTDPNREKLIRLDDSDHIFRECQDIAAEVLDGRTPDPTGGADFYYNPKLAAPKWALGHEPCARIGHHVFFRGIA